MREVGYSGRISNKRKSYKESEKRRRADKSGLIEEGDLADDDDESLEKKLARLRREIAEVKEETQRRGAENESKKSEEQHPSADDIGYLSQTLDSVEFSEHLHRRNAATKLVQQLNAPLERKSTGAEPNGVNVGNLTQANSGYTFSYSPNYQDRHTLAKVADFDSRLSMLERILGIDTIPLPTQDHTPNKAILPALESLDRQMSAVSNSSDSFLDATHRRIRQLTFDAEKLTEARKAARAAQESLDESQTAERRTEASSQDPQQSKDPEQVYKINALYGTLPTIESLSPLLPPLLDKLRSLRSIHGDAANASQNLARVESRQETMTDELQHWREGLEKVEAALKQSEQTMSGNLTTVESWVKELEERMAKFSR